MARARIAKDTPLDEIADELAELGRLEEDGLEVEHAQRAIALFPFFFGRPTSEAGYDARKARGITTKFRDAGRRSPPWRPASARVPGRPQDGADGNRRNRWLFDEDHKFWADEL